MDLTKKLSLLVFLVCIFTSLKGEKKASSPSLDDPSASEHYLREDEALIYDFYSASCPSAEKLIQKMVREYVENIAIAPALLRLLFHDCFVMGPRSGFDIKQAIQSFASKGFDARETVALLGAHSTGMVHCEFFRDRLFNFSRTGGPDPSINAEFLEVLRSQCSHPAPASSTSFENRGMRMDYQGLGKGFGEVYYRSLIQGRGLLFVDQQLTTKAWVEAYASDVLGFRREFGQAMFKLSHLQVAKKGQVRLNCRKVN